MDIQKLTDTDLTAAQERLLEVLINPEHRRKSITDVCKLANCTRPVYYAALKNKDFVGEVTKVSKSLIAGEILPILHSCIKQAKAGEFQHAKLLLEMYGLYNPKIRHDIDMNMGFDNELMELLEQKETEVI